MKSSTTAKTVLDTAIGEKIKNVEASFLKEWSQKDFETVQKAIVNHFRSQEIKTHHGNHPARYRSFERLGEIMGFAYTSTAAYAGYWVCNTSVYCPFMNGFEYGGFALSSDGKVYAWLKKDEEDSYLSI